MQTPDDDAMGDEAAWIPNDWQMWDAQRNQEEEQDENQRINH